MEIFHCVLAKTVINNPAKFYAICLPPGCITRSNLHLQLLPLYVQSEEKVPGRKLNLYLLDL